MTMLDELVVAGEGQLAKLALVLQLVSPDHRVVATVVVDDVVVGHPLTFRRVQARVEAQQSFSRESLLTLDTS